MVLDAFFLAVDVNPIRRIDLRIDPALMKIRRLRIPSQGLARQGWDKTVFGPARLISGGG